MLYLSGSFYKLRQIEILCLYIDVQIRLEALTDETVERGQIRFQVNSSRRLWSSRLRGCCGLVKKWIIGIRYDWLVERIIRIGMLGLVERLLVLKIMPMRN